ncbi:MAG TPA: hypothetical protein VJG65_00340 [Patescibacteria group bacterium]|nr:hypothetical protein [Patescibacteria group bacterium]
MSNKSELKPGMMIKHRKTGTMAKVRADPKDPEKLYPVIDECIAVVVPNSCRGRFPNRAIWLLDQTELVL